MVVKPEQERVRTLLSDTITLLCRNGLTYKSKFCISALVGITIDENEVFLVDIRETIKNNEAEDAESNPSESEAVASPKSPSAKRRKRRKRSRASVSSNEQGDNGASRTDDEESSDLPAKKNKEIKQELDEDDDSQDLVFIKDEPGVSDMSSMNSSYQGHSQSYSQPQPQGDILTNLAQQGQLFATPSSNQLQGVPPGGSWDPSSGQQTFAAHPPSTSGAMQGSSSQAGGAKFSRHIATISQAERRRTDSSHLKCYICEQVFSRLRLLTSHLASVHGIAELKVTCPVCFRNYSRKDHMKAHMRKVHGSSAMLGHSEATGAFRSVMEQQLLETQSGGSSDKTSVKAEVMDNLSEGDSL